VAQIVAAAGRVTAPAARKNPHRRTTSRALEPELADRSLTGSAYARRASRAAGMADMADAFAPEALSGELASQVLGDPSTSPRRRAALLEAAKVRALTASYSRRGGGLLTSAAHAVEGVDPHTGVNFHVQKSQIQLLSSPKRNSQGKRETSFAQQSALSSTAATAALSARERAFQYAEQHSSAGAELQRALAMVSVPSPQVHSHKRRTAFREQLLRQSALMEQAAEAKEGVIRSSQHPLSTTPHALAALMPPAAEALSSSTAGSAPPPLDGSQALVVHHNWRVVLGTEPSDRSESEVEFLAQWLAARTRYCRFWRALPLDTLRFLARRDLRLRTAEPGQPVQQEGEAVVQMHLLLEGHVMLQLSEAEKHAQREAARAQRLEQRHERQAHATLEQERTEAAAKVIATTQAILSARRASMALSPSPTTLLSPPSQRQSRRGSNSGTAGGA